LHRAGLARLGPDEGTYPADEPTAIIDHVYGTPGWAVREVYTIPSLASDHRPVVMDLLLGESGRV
jgi:endonuclease/exonuclease/phosphatase family metal-dependent hydrolase